MAYPVRALRGKLSGLTAIPGSTWWKKRRLSYELSHLHRCAMHACVHTINVCAPHGHTLKKKKRQTYVLTCFYDRNRPFLAFRNKHIPILEQNTAIVHLVFLRFFILGQILRGWTLHPWARLKRGPSGKLWAKCSYSIASTMTNFFSLFLYEPSDSELFAFKCPQASKDYWKALCRNNPQQVLFNAILQ